MELKEKLNSLTKSDLMILGVFVSMYRKNNFNPVLQGDVFRYVSDKFKLHKTIFYTRVKNLEKLDLLKITNSNHRKMIIPTVSIKEFENYACEWCNSIFFFDEPTLYLDNMLYLKLCKVKDVNFAMKKHKVKRGKRTNKIPTTD